MKAYQKEFIQFALEKQALKFGEFKLKSGRISPYFFNAGAFADGQSFQKLGMFYADAILENFNGQFDVLFGPAYKGIPLATAASIGLAMKGHNTSMSFNRKEAKDHGEGGVIVGTSLQGKRVLLIDDVITAGTAVRESVDVINREGGKLMGVIISVNRQERGLKSPLSAIQEVQQEFHLKVADIICLDDLVTYLEQNPDNKTWLESIKKYREQYGIQNSRETDIHS